MRILNPKKGQYNVGIIVDFCNDGKVKILTDENTIITRLPKSMYYYNQRTTMFSNNQEMGQAQKNNNNGDPRVTRNTRHQRAKQKWSKNRQNINLAGKTRKMNGQVFQL